MWPLSCSLACFHGEKGKCTCCASASASKLYFALWGDNIMILQAMLILFVSMLPVYHQCEWRWARKQQHLDPAGLQLSLQPYCRRAINMLTPQTLLNTKHPKAYCLTCWVCCCFYFYFIFSIFNHSHPFFKKTNIIIILGLEYTIAD